MIKFHSHLNGPLKTDASDNHFSEVPQDGEPEKQLFTTHQTLATPFWPEKMYQEWGRVILWASPLEKMSSAKCQRNKNQLYTQSWSFLYPKCVLDSSSLSISKGFTQTKIEDICGSQSGFNRMSFHHLKFHLGFFLFEIWAWSYQSHFSSLLHL